jgi:hypothetical protein
MLAVVAAVLLAARQELAGQAAVETEALPAQKPQMELQISVAVVVAVAAMLRLTQAVEMVVMEL